MKILTLFLSLFLALMSEAIPYDNYYQGEDIWIGEAPSSDRSMDHRLNRDLCIASAQSYSFSGGSNIQSVSLRTSQTGRRTSPETKSTSRIVKSGKIIDNNHLHPFLTLSFCVLSGPFTSERYLYSLCRLRC